MESNQSSSHSKTFEGIIVGLIIGVLGTVLLIGFSEDSGTKVGWTPDHTIWAYQSCTNEGGAGDEITEEWGGNYLQFCKEAIVCAADTEPAADVNIDSYEALSGLLARCEAGIVG